MIRLTSRKKRPLNRTIPYLRDAKLIIIATEGEETEKQYFSMFHSTRVQVKVLPTTDSKSSPEYVLKRLKEFKDEYELDDDDELWLMVDVDRWRSKKLSAIAKESKKNQFKLAISNPCFECWLYLHFDMINTSLTCRQINQQLKVKLGKFNKLNIDLTCFKDKIDDAITHSKILDQGSGAARWPTSIGTHVYQGRSVNQKNTLKKENIGTTSGILSVLIPRPLTCHNSLLNLSLL